MGDGITIMGFFTLGLMMIFDAANFGHAGGRALMMMLLYL